MKIVNIKFADVNPNDYPDFSDAYIESAEFENGTPLSEVELEMLDIGDFHELIYESLF